MAAASTSSSSSRHRIRYTNEDGVVIHDKLTGVSYEFTTIDSALTFQGDLRRKDLVDCFDTDVVWTDKQSRTNALGDVRGIGTMQRLKLWSDRLTSAHSLTVFANHGRPYHGGSDDGRVYHEFQVDSFEGDLRARDGRRRLVQLDIRGSRRGTINSSVPGTVSAGGRRAEGGIRYVGIQFSRDEDVDIVWYYEEEKG
ncbi:hypothetical protein KJ359_002060 [Pestalotiopsis sp. 9143b]|nr:hypothetical protein KJ359_002060 [Pestalotiopsis sp. 9143b]